MPEDVHPVRTVAAAVLGGAVGAAVAFLGVGQAVSLVMADEPGSTAGLAAVGAAVVAGGIGAFVGAAAALAVTFRDEPAAARRRTVLAVLLGGPVLFGLVAVGFAQVDQDLNLPPLWLAVVLPAAALLGRWWAVRSGAHRPG